MTDMKKKTGTGTGTHTQAHTHTGTRARARMHAHAHARTRTHARTDTHACTRTFIGAFARPLSPLLFLAPPITNSRLSRACPSAGRRETPPLAPLESGDARSCCRDGDTMSRECV